MDRELQNLLNEYFEPATEKIDINDMFRLVEEIMESTTGLIVEREQVAPTEEDPSDKKEDLQIFIPRIRISEKMWGQQGSEDREIIQSLLTRLVGSAGGTTLKEKVEKISEFLEERPQTDDISEILTHIVLLDTLTNIMLHFNASAAGFTFEGFLSALLSGTQIPAGTAGIQDLIDADDNPISLKLLTGAGSAGSTGNVHGSYKDLVDHFIDPAAQSTGARRSEKTYTDPETGEEVVNPHYVGQAGAAGTMTYVVVLKSFRDMESTKKLSAEEIAEGGEPETIRFFQFDFTAKTFFEALITNKHNAKLLLLPKEEFSQSDEDPAAQPEQEAYDPISVEDQKRMLAGRNNGFDPGTAWAYRKIVKNYVPEYARELLDGATLRPTEKNPKKLELVNADGEPIRYAELPPADPRRKDIASTAYTQKTTPDKKDIDPKTGKARVSTVEWLDYGTSVKILKSKLSENEENPVDFWNLIARTSGYTGAAEETQFVVSPRYYRQKRWEQDGFGYIGQIYVGKAAVRALAVQYAEILNQKIYDMFKKVQTLSQQINGYFIGGDKGSALEAASTADEIKTGAEEYHEQDIQQAAATKK